MLKSAASTDNSLDHLAINKQGILRFAEVREALAYTNCYVIEGAGLPPMPAMLLSQGSMLPIGARVLEQLIPGTVVLAYVTPDEPMAQIIGTISRPNTIGGVILPDSISPGSNTGFFGDPMHYNWYTGDDASGLFDLSGGRPVDTVPGDWGAVNEFGAGIILGKLVALLKASEFCKVEAHVLDNLLRITGYNLQEWTSGSSKEAFNDEGEFTTIEGYSMYGWESLGLITAEEPFTETEVTPGDGTEAQTQEPQEPNQLAHSRFITYKGYLGDVKRNMVVAPTDPLMTYGAEQPNIGLLEEVYGADGSYRLRSASSISFEKTLWIPVPVPIVPRDHPDGDTDFEPGKGANEKEDTIPAFPDNLLPGEATARILEQHAFYAARGSNQGFRIRKKDWDYPTEPAMAGGVTSPINDKITPFTTQEAEEAESNEQYIDHRQTTKYYRSTSGIHMLEDGGIMLSDGYGSSITLSKGNIEITCPGDITKRTGRDLVSVIGRACEQTVKGHIAVSAGADYRIKAEDNLMMLGGNSGTGGVLIEDRSSGDTMNSPDIADNYIESGGEDLNLGGIIFKSAKGSVTSWSKNLYFKTFPEAGGTMVFDAGEGDGDIHMYANNYTRVIKGAFDEIIVNANNVPHDDISFTHRSLGTTVTRAPTVINIVDSLQVAGSRSRRTNVFIGGSTTIDGTVAATGSVGENVNLTTNPASAINAIELSVEGVDIENTTLIREQDYETNEAGSGSTPGLGVSDSFTKTGFFFRRTEDVTPDGFKMMETSWQQLFSLQSSGSGWTEPVTVLYVDPIAEESTALETLAYPGYDAWTDPSLEAYVKIKPKLFDSSLTYKPWTDTIYDELTYDSSDREPHELNGFYLINE